MANLDNSILVQVHSSSTGDPFYTKEMSDRASFMGSLFSGWPTLIVDGLSDPWDGSHYTFANVTQEIHSRLSISTPVTIKITGVWNAITRKIKYTAEIESDTPITAQNLKFLIFVTESDIHYSAVSGQVHNHVTRDIVPNTSGIGISSKSDGSAIGINLDFTDSQDLTEEVSGTIEVDHDWNINNISIVGIVQDFSTKEVYQAEEVTYPTLDISDESGTTIPEVFALHSVYPNPFNPVVNIPFTLDRESSVNLNIFNINGELIETLIEKGNFNAGYHTQIWNAGAHAAGPYLIQIQTPYNQAVQKAILLK